MALAGGPGGMACLLVLALALAVAAVADGAISSPSPAPAPAVDCTAEAFKVIDCLDYVTPGRSAPSRPSKVCCGEVKTTVKDHVAVGCLCTFFSAKNTAIPLNFTRVLQLPTACGADNVFNKCPGHAPSPSPAAASSGGGSGTSPKGAAAARTPAVASTAAILLAAAVAFFHL
ncbi:hypothetical protein ABZP36_005303 [Zizania latifolia]